MFRTFDPTIGFEPKKPEKYAYCQEGHYVSLEEVRRDINGIEVCSRHLRRIEKSDLRD